VRFAHVRRFASRICAPHVSKWYAGSACFGSATCLAHFAFERAAQHALEDWRTT